MSESLLMVQNIRASSLMMSLRVSSYHRCATCFSSRRLSPFTMR
ncbi:hypothetical protein ACFFL1_05225 [Samsonia erythrinae]|uniref:Uncharacterized protein n=1 Tax=Samsonia erythrinae TaxID=160434 RepID=A0A4R3VRL6_9GAMM|nr:hypothetical protein [Samsonia erythrinae]TCV08599.1 hypothetical protein EDC54_101102 [Samsonia erythrinae]